MLITLFMISLLSAAVLLFIMRYIKHRRKQRLRRSRETWAIGIYEGPSPSKLFSPIERNNPILCAKDVTDLKARFVADPFMVQNEHGYHLFFEVLNNKRDVGEIGYAFSQDSRQWDYCKIVLKERYHLSYPYLFLWNGNYYMIPECETSGGIQLYMATLFPEQWKHRATLIKRKNEFSAMTDPSIIHYQDHWYLFSYCRKNQSLHLFTAKTLIGTWEEHPKSPIVRKSQRFARPGGRVINHNGIIYRYAQDEIPLYGSRVWAFKITELTEKCYKEEKASDEPVVQAGSDWWNSSGMHTVDPHQTSSGQWIAVVDGFRIDQQRK